MKITPAPSIESMSGKFCKRNGQYVALNKKTGKMYMGERHEQKDANSEKQQEIRSTFKSKSAAASAWWNKHKAANDEPWKEFRRMYDQQHKYGNPYQMLRSMVEDDLSITIAGVKYAFDGTTTTPPQQDDDERMD